MTPKTWLFALAGMIVFGLLLLAIPIDVCLLSTGHDTISRWHMLMGLAHPRWFPTLIVASVLLPIGMFMGHYWSPGNVPFWQTSELWLQALILAPVILFVGILLSRLFVAQTL